MSRKLYFTTAQEVLGTKDVFPQLVKITEGSENIQEALDKLAEAGIPVCAPTLRTTVLTEIDKGNGKGRVRKNSDLFNLVTIKKGRGPDKAPRSRRTKAEMQAMNVPAPVVATA